MGNDLRLSTHVIENTPFAAAVAWERLFAAEVAVQCATQAGIDHPIHVAIHELRDAVWDELCSKTNYDERTEVLARARAYVVDHEHFVTDAS